MIRGVEEAFLIGLPALEPKQNNKGKEADVSAKIERVTHDPRLHVATVAAFLVMTYLGAVTFGGGQGFVQLWSGSVAAIIATAFLVTKSQGYWAWMVVNAGLWVTLFLREGLPMLAWLQVSFLVICGYGAFRWLVVERWKIGYLGTQLDKVGVVLAAGVFAWSVVAYWHMPGYALSSWWWVEFGSVLTAIAAIAMDAYRYKANWVAWTLSNCCSAPLFFHLSLWGPFVTLFVYQAINVVGFVVWATEERAIHDAKILEAELEMDAGARRRGLPVEVLYHPERA